MLRHRHCYRHRHLKTLHRLDLERNSPNSDQVNAGLESFLRLTEVSTERINEPRPDFRFTVELELLQKLNRVPFSKSNHEFWHENRKKFPLLYDFACVIIAAPPTEVSVERNFSKLKFVLNRLRCRITDKEFGKKFIFEPQFRII